MQQTIKKMFFVAKKRLKGRTKMVDKLINPKKIKRKQNKREEVIKRVFGQPNFCGADSALAMAKVS